MKTTMNSVFLRLLLASLGVGVGVGVRLRAMGGPRYVVEGGNVSLICDYDLEGDELYSLLWWRDGSVLLRYTAPRPDEGADDVTVTSNDPALLLDPISNVTTRPLAWFPSPSVTAFLAEEDSPRHLVLVGVGPQASAVYSCEVTTEAPPTFLTANASVAVHVVVPPTGSPILKGVGGEVREGEWVRAQCDSAPSLPAPNITFFINGRQVVDEFVSDVDVRETMERLLVSSRSLSFKAYSQLFSHGPLTLECRVQIHRLSWISSSELELEGYGSGAWGLSVGRWGASGGLWGALGGFRGARGALTLPFLVLWLLKMI